MRRIWPLFSAFNAENKLRIAENNGCNLRRGCENVRWQLHHGSADKKKRVLVRIASGFIGLTYAGFATLLLHNFWPNIELIPGGLAFIILDRLLQDWGVDVH